MVPFSRFYFCQTLRVHASAMVRLVVAEKPSVARDLARVLGARQRQDGFLQGKDLWITWCIGHVVQLCAPETYNPAWKAWRTNHLPMLPETFKLEPTAASHTQWAVLKKLLRHKEVHEVVNACDAGREGELIFRLAAELAGCRKPMQRLWLSALTDSAIRTAFANLRPSQEYDALGDAARCRSEADWLVGLNATRALTLRQRALGADHLLTVGRVQTPTLAMLVRREAEIEQFVPEPFWQVVAQFDTAQAARYSGVYTRNKQDRLPSLAAAEAIATAVSGKGGRVHAVEHKEQREKPPLLYDLTALQRRANQRYHMSAADTLAAAQTLYEKHKALTYPRTDSHYITQDMASTLPALLKSLNRPPYAEHVAPLLAHKPLQPGPRMVCDSEVGDHHAIIPTGRPVEIAGLPLHERQVFDLVARRFIAAFLPPAIFALSRIDTQVGEHLFISRGRSCKQVGWQAVEPPPPSRDKETLLPHVKRDEPVQTWEARVHAAATKPPPRFNEAMLLGAMERAGGDLEKAELRRAMKDAGLGTAATRAAIIEALHRRRFVQRDGKLLVPTAEGRQLIDAVPVESLKSPELTGAWEARLGLVAQRRLSRVAFMGEVREFAAHVVRQILHPDAPQKQASPAAHLCPRCKKAPLIAGRHAWGCARWRSGCSLVIPFAPFGQPLPADDLAALIKHGQVFCAVLKTTLVLDPTGPNAVSLRPCPSPLAPPTA